MTQVLLALYKLRPERVMRGKTCGAKLVKKLFEAYNYEAYVLYTDRKRIKAIVHCLAGEVHIEPQFLHGLLENECWEELSKLFFDDQWQFSASHALLALFAVDMSDETGFKDPDYIRILQCFYAYILPEPIVPGADAEEVTSLLSELTLKNSSPDSA